MLSFLNIVSWRYYDKICSRGQSFIVLCLTNNFKFTNKTVLPPRLVRLLIIWLYFVSLSIELLFIPLWIQKLSRDCNKPLLAIANVEPAMPLQSRFTPPDPPSSSSGYLQISKPNGLSLFSTPLSELVQHPTNIAQWTLFFLILTGISN